MWGEAWARRTGRDRGCGFLGGVVRMWALLIIEGRGYEWAWPVLGQGSRRLPALDSSWTQLFAFNSPWGARDRCLDRGLTRDISEVSRLASEGQDGWRM